MTSDLNEAADAGLELQRWVWNNVEDWIKGTPGERTIRRLQTTREMCIPEDLFVFLAPNLATCSDSRIRSIGIQAAANQMLSERAQREVALEISGILRENDIDHVFVKGLDFRYRLYPEPHRRISTDADLLIAPEERRQVLDLLVRSGCSLRDSSEQFLSGGHHEVALRYKEVTLDLHTSMLQTGRSLLDTRSVLDSAVTIEVEDGALPVASKEDAVALALIHTGRHEGGAEYIDFKHGLDLALVFKCWPELDWPAVARKVRCWRCLRLAGAGLWTWEPLMGGLIPRMALAVLDPGWLQRSVAQRTRRVLWRSKVSSSGILRLSQLSRKFLYAEGWPERMWLFKELFHRISGRK